MTVTTVNTNTSEADRLWGWEFGVDGVVNMDDARTMLARAGKNTVLRRADQGLIRQGKEGGRLVFCRRSINEYLKTLES